MADLAEMPGGIHGKLRQKSRFDLNQIDQTCSPDSS